MSPEENPGARPAGDVFVEFVRQGNAVKATAIDAASGVEASIVGPATAANSDLQQLALTKLRRLLGWPDSQAPSEKAPPPKGRGIIV